MSGDAPDHGHDWEAALDSLEREVRLAEQMAVDPSWTPTAEQPVPSAWAPPELEGTIPAGLVARAQELLGRQAAVRAELARSLDRARADLARLRRPTPGHRPQAPAYVDISA